jgi:AcrR family transcriptional regulator
MTYPDDPRERLLNVAGELFAEKGFDGTTVREIIRKAGVNIAAVNYYFRDKERLYIEAVKQASCGSQLHQAMRDWPPETPPAEKLRGFIRGFVAKLLDKDRPAWHARLMMREMAQPTEACVELVRDFIRPMAELLMGVLGELLPPETPLWKRWATGFSVVGQCLHYVHCKPVIRRLVGEEDLAHLTAEAVADHITGFTLAALGQKGPGRRL